MHPQASKARLASLVVLVVIGAITLVPNPGAREMAALTPVWCLICGDHGSIDVIMNMLLFAPLGVAWFFMGWPLKRIAAVAFSASLAIELLQMWVIDGRDASISDIVTNTLGAGMGYRLATDWRGLLEPRPNASFRLFVLSLTLWLGVTAMTAAGLTPEFSGKLYGQWAPELGGFDQFQGTVVQAIAASGPLPDGPYSSEEGIREALRRGTADFRAKVVTGPTPERLAPMVTVVNDRPTILLMLGQHRTDLFFSGRTRSGRFRFRTPHMTLEDVFPEDEAAEREVGGRLGRRTISAWVVSGDRRLSRSVPLSSNWGWLLLSPFAISLGASTPVLSGLWLAVLFFPVSYWMTGIPGSRKALAVALLAAATVGGLLGIPVAAGFDPISWYEWAGAFSGLIVGRLVGAYSMRRSSVASRQQFGSSVA